MLLLHGVGTVDLLPSTNALVSLTEWPAFVISLDDIELAHFERVTSNMRSFDVVFVLKDYSKPVVTISAIPAGHLDQVQKWLDSCDVRYTDGNAKLLWNDIMKHITTDPDGFFADGGWSVSSQHCDETSCVIFSSSHLPIIYFTFHTLLRFGIACLRQIGLERVW